MGIRYALSIYVYGGHTNKYINMETAQNHIRKHEKCLSQINHNNMLEKLYFSWCAFKKYNRQL